MNTLKLSIGVLMLALLACSKPESSEHREHGALEEVEKGPNGGRLLEDGPFAVEVTIFERGTPPEFRLFAAADGKPVKPNEVVYTIELTRFSGKREIIEFQAKDSYSVGNKVVEEPHSFDVKVTAQYKGTTHEWKYESYEGRVAIVEEMAKEAGVEIGTIGPGKLKEFVSLHGVIEPDPAHMRSISARYAGVIQKVNGQVGESIEAGETLAVVESNESLQKYSVIAPISGVMTMRRANVGETAGSEPLFEIADFSSVRAELSVFPRDFARLKKGQEVSVRSADGKFSAIGKLNYLATSGERNQSLAAHVSIDNKSGQWTPGLFVSAEVVVSERSVALSVPLTALQKFRDWDVLFLNDGETYQAMPVELGENDGVSAEIKAGVAGGERFVTKNSYLIKADIEKAGASHDH